MRHALVSLLLLIVPLVGCAVAEEPPRRLTILHVNDLHARLLPDDSGRGGFAQLAALIKRECDAARACLVLDAGDLVQGSPVSSLFRGLPIFDVANGLGLHASTLGNHEFDYGWQAVAGFLETAQFPVVTANIVNESGELLADAPYVVLEVGGLRVGVIGVLTATLPQLVTPDKYRGWVVLPAVEAVRRHLPQVAPLADLVVVLGHLTDEEEAAVAGVSGITAVVSGHGHQGLDQPRVTDDCPVVRVAAYGRELGRLELTLDDETSAVRDWRWQSIAVDGSVAPDAAVAARVAHWEGKVAEIVDVPIGDSARRLDHAEVRTLLERALRETTAADLGYVNAGGVRDTLPAGRLLARHLWNVMPFDNHVVVGRFRGRELPQRVVEERRLDPDRIYRLATMDFVATMWNQQRTQPLQFEDTGRLVRDVAMDWIREHTPLD